MRPGIVLKGVEQPGQFGELTLVPVLKLAAAMKRLRQEFAAQLRDSPTVVSTATSAPADPYAAPTSASAA